MKSELKRGFSSPEFWRMILVLFLCFQGYAVPSYISDCINESIELRQSALSLTLGGVFFGGLILLLPFCSAMVYAGNQVDDIRSDFFYFSILRSSIKRYAVDKLITAFVCGFLAAVCAFLLHAALWHILSLPYDPIRYPKHEIGFWKDSFFYSWQYVHNGWPIVLCIALGMGIAAGVWSVVSLAVAVWIPDKMLVSIIPACLFKLWNMQISLYLVNIRFPGLDTIFNDAQTINEDLSCLLAYGIIFVIAATIYYIGVRRRGLYA